MATQTGIVVAGPNQPYTVVKDLVRPKPGDSQVLVKSLVTGINPVEPFMQHSGMLVLAWPAVLGCEASGVVVECGDAVSRLKVGDYVYGCTAVGQNQCSTFQEHFLMDEDLALKRGSKLSEESACTVGVALYTAALALLAGANMSLPTPGTKAEPRNEWVVVLGGSGSVGSFASQLARLCGYDVLATCSPSKNAIVQAQGAKATVNGRASEEQQVAEIRKATGGNFARVFDASAYGYGVAIKALQEASSSQEKWFTTVDDWSDYNTPASIHEYRTRLGLLGRRNDKHGSETTKDIASWVPLFEDFIQREEIVPLDYQLVDGSGWDKVIDAVAVFESGQASKKLVVRIQDE